MVYNVSIYNFRKGSTVMGNKSARSFWFSGWWFSRRFALPGIGS